MPQALAAKLIAATEWIGEDFDGIRMDDIAEVTGVPRATLYYYFSGKEDILAYLLHGRLADHREVIDAILRDTRSSTRSRLHAVLEGHVGVIASNPAAAQLLLLNLAKLGKFPDVRAAGDEALLDPVRIVLADGIRRREIRPVDVTLTAAAMCGAANNVAMLETSPLSPAEVTKRADGLLALFWPALRRQPRPSTRRG